MNERVLNLRDLKGKPWPSDVVRIDRATRWGNPFSHLRYSAAQFHVATRDDAISAYRTWLLDEVLVKDPDFLEPLRGKRLACWCSPLACHGEVNLEVLDGTE